MQQRPRITLLHVEIDASWRSLVSALLIVCGVLWLAWWWVR